MIRIFCRSPSACSLEHSILLSLSPLDVNHHRHTQKDVKKAIASTNVLCIHSPVLIVYDIITLLCTGRRKHIVRLILTSDFFCGVLFLTVNQPGRENSTIKGTLF